MFQKDFPILIKKVDAVPLDNITCEKYSEMMRVYQCLTYDAMIQSNISVRHLHEMGCDLAQVLHSWGEPKHAENLIWNGTDKKTIMAVHMALQKNQMKKKFKEINWFRVGMSLADIINIKPRVSVLRSFNVNFKTLIEKHANEYGANWQDLFNWTREEWKDLGYDENVQEYKNRIQNDRNLSESKCNVLLAFGPKHGIIGGGG